MEINYVDKFPILTSDRLSKESVFTSETLDFSIQTIKSILVTFFSVFIKEN